MTELLPANAKQPMNAMLLKLGHHTRAVARQSSPSNEKAYPFEIGKLCGCFSQIQNPLLLNQSSDRQNNNIVCAESKLLPHRPTNNRVRGKSRDIDPVTNNERTRLP